MRFRVFICLAALTLLCAASRKIGTAKAEDDAAEITATVINDPDAIREVLGSDLDGHYILVQAQIEPKTAGPLPIQLDDFLLKTDKDGSRTTPFAPSQVAGRGALVVQTVGEGGGTFGRRGGPAVGYPGPMGPARLPGHGGGFGNAGGVTASKATVHSGAKDKDNPLLKVLQEKMLPDKAAGQPVSGLLYFPMEKQKLKDLELIYTTPAGKLNLRFR